MFFHRHVILHPLLGCMSACRACFCDRYPWSPWSACTRTCNHGVQRFQYDDYFWKNSCRQLCDKYDRRACNQQACPINCLLTEFGPWSECSACARKQLRTRAIQRPSQFGGSDCSVELTEERPCYPSTECKLPEADCRDDFKCDNGRCINSTLTCNSQNDCVDNSDERGCDTFKVVCPADKRVAPGADLVGNGFDALAEEPRAAVLDNMFMGGICRIRRPQSTLLYHRVPHNFQSLEIKVFQSTINSSAFWNDSTFIRVHQVLPVSTFEMKPPEDLVLSQPFLQFLQALPLDYNYGLYRDIFQRFGTHYYSSGKLGGHYDLLYQYSREEMTTSGETEEHVKGCLSKETTWTVILYTEHSSVQRCGDNRMTERYHGSYVQAAEKSFSMVKGGRTREAAALAWERQGAAPDKTAFKNWAKSVLDNPAVVDYQLLPIVDLVRGIPCAVTKRRHLRRALLQYLQEFDTCRCAPCPNNARPILSGTECKCVCQTGTFGDNCEKRAPDYTSEVVDGYWSCWGPWSSCGATMKRHRTRRCDNPAPLRGGQPCEGPAKQEDQCHISIFEKQETCDNDDDFTMGWRNELPPGVEGCLRPDSPANSYLRKSKQYYSFGEDEEFKCFTGFSLEGFQFINCLPGGTWSQPRGRCVSKSVHGRRAGFLWFPNRSSVLHLQGRSASLPTSPTEPFVPDVQCRPGEKRQGSQCVCVQRESCLSQTESLCVLNMNLGVTVPMSICSFHAGRCHGDPLFFVSEGSCEQVDAAKLEWAKFRAKMSSRSAVQEPCDLDTCYEWETCSAAKKCECRTARECPAAQTHMFCVKLTRVQGTRSLSLCSIASLKCANYQFEIMSEGVC
uniref:Complement component 6 n=1 Tax=Salarias fasciatus TaxID=181472 RepID=A0A672JR31_SALFA